MKYEHIDSEESDLESAPLTSNFAKNGSNSSRLFKKLFEYINFRAIVELFLCIFVLILILQNHSSDPSTRILSPGESTFIPIPNRPMKMTATDYYLDSSMFYNQTILEERLARFRDISSDDRGLVTIPDWRQHRLPKPMTTNIHYLGGPDEEKETYQIAYYHHVHCIATLAKTYAHARMHPHEYSKEADEHTVHCLEVLRLAVMCLADTTPEDGVEFWQNTHQCRDHEALRAWSRDNAAWNMTDIIGPRVDFL